MPDDVRSRIISGENFAFDLEYDFDKTNRSYIRTTKRGRRWIHIENTTILDDRGRISGYMLTNRDVTKRKQREEERLRMSRRLEENVRKVDISLRGGQILLWEYDVPDDRLKFDLNSDHELGVSPSLGDYLNGIHPDDLLVLKDDISKLRNGTLETFSFNLRYKTPNGKQWAYVALGGEPYEVNPAGRVVRYIGYRKDNTEWHNLNATLQESNLLLGSIMQQTPCGMFVKDVTDGFRYVMFNDQMVQWTGVSSQRACGGLDSEIFADYADSFRRDDQKAVELDGKVHSYVENVLLRGQFLNLHTHKVLVKTALGRRFLVCVSLNITQIVDQQRELEAVNKKDQLLLNNIGAGLMFIGNDFRIKWSNNAYAGNKNIAKYKDGHICYQCVEGRQTPCEGCVIVEAQSTGKYAVGQKVFADGTILGTTAMPIVDDSGVVEGFVCRLDDITKRVKAEAELEDAKRRAEQSDKLKSAFLANMSHEIRTPLNAIVGFSELLANSESKSRSQEYTRIINANNELLLRLINDILDLSKIESGIVDRSPERVDVARIAQEIYTTYKQRVTNPDVEFVLDNPYASCWTTLDRNRLRQNWSNYITNAIKCTMTGHIKMGYAVERGGLRFYVEDTGVGIAKDDHPKVFGRFQKLNRFSQGTGLGLAICKAMIEMAGGEVGFDSELGRGSTFWLWLPFEAEVGEEATADVDLSDSVVAAAHVGEQSVVSVRRVLLAEDNHSNYLLMSYVFKNEELTWVENGADAVNAVREREYDIVFMDMNMPIMDGIEATRLIREFDADIPIVALTANVFDSDRRAALDAGCSDFTTKPVKRNELYALMDRLIKR